MDLHFHGAFGIDLMTARESDLNELSQRLYEDGVSGFCPTTLSAAPEALLQACQRLGKWIRSEAAPGALPLGIHLEGPFISPKAAGAHPPGVLRSLTPAEIEELWNVSSGTLKILTLAPETLDLATTRWIQSFAKKNRIRLSIGHTRCTESQARMALNSGFTGVTHAWNALSYHHRDAGVLGAAFGKKKVFTELIIDGIHVSETFIDWSLRLHPEGVIFVSDAAPAAGTDGSTFHRFGELECRFAEGASRLPDGSLAGGGTVLPAAFLRWLKEQARREHLSFQNAFKKYLPHLTERPLRAIFLSNSVLKERPVDWKQLQRHLHRSHRKDEVKEVPIPLKNK